MIPESFTPGVEEEYQLVDPGTGELRSRPGVVRRADRSGEVEGEVQDTVLEIGTPVCRTAAEAAARLRERRFQASAAAAAEDLDSASATFVRASPISSRRSSPSSPGSAIPRQWQESGIS
jgi:carboxylate-amine ligase